MIPHNPKYLFSTCGYHSYPMGKGPEQRERALMAPWRAAPALQTLTAPWRAAPSPADPHGPVVNSPSPEDPHGPVESSPSPADPHGPMERSSSPAGLLPPLPTAALSREGSGCHSCQYSIYVCVWATPEAGN